MKNNDIPIPNINNLQGVNTSYMFGTLLVRINKEKNPKRIVAPIVWIVETKFINANKHSCLLAIFVNLY